MYRVKEVSVDGIDSLTDSLIDDALLSDTDEPLEGIRFSIASRPGKPLGPWGPKKPRSPGGPAGPAGP